jgi:hypothetical protein
LIKKAGKLSEEESFVLAVKLFSFAGFRVRSGDRYRLEIGDSSVVRRSGDFGSLRITGKKIGRDY